MITAAVVLGVLALVGTVLGVRLAAAGQRADSMRRHPAGRHRPERVAVVLGAGRFLTEPEPEPARCGVCGWPVTSYQHYCECRNDPPLPHPDTPRRA